MRRYLRCDEELGAVGVLAGVGHGQPARAVVLQLEVLVGELLAVDGSDTIIIITITQVLCLANIFIILCRRFLTCRQFHRPW